MLDAVLSGQARTYQSMHQIRGQSAAVNLLLDQLRAGRPHHAYIFHGPAGVGKFTTAVAFAQLLLCHNRLPDDDGNPTACGQCKSCRLLARHTPETGDALESPHPDLHIIAKELAATSSVATVRQRKQTTIPVDLLREHVVGGKTSDGHDHSARAYQSPRLSHGKVFIIDEAELLAREGQNVLLKTLEEPPSGTTLILITSSEDRLLPTIRSRCQRVAFLPLPDDVIGDWLDGHGGTRGGLGRDLELTDRQRAWLIDFAGGSLGRAALALDNDLLSWAKAVLPAMEDMAHGRPRPQLGADIAGFVNQFAEAWVAARPNASKEAANKLAGELMWSLIAGHARRRLHQTAEACSAADPLANEPRVEPYLGVIDAVEQVQQRLATNVNLSLACDELSVTMHQRLAGAAS